MQDILLYGSETWVILISMEKKIEGTNIEFMRMITGKISNHLGGDTWETPGAECTQEEAGNH